MKTNDIFKLAVRLVGLVFVYQGLTALPLAASEVHTALVGGQLLDILISLVVALLPFGIAYWFFRGAAPIVRIAYPDAPETTKQGTQVGGSSFEQKVGA